MALLGAPTPAAESPDTSGASPAATGSPESGTRRGAVRFGDTLNLVFYESLDQGDDKWKTQPGRSAAPPKGFYQRAELTGEYTVENDGTISLPLIGRVKVVGSLPSEIEAGLAQPFAALVDRKGFVNLLSVRHEPIYVTGPVRNPGAFPYDEGMTVAQALALSGGVDQTRIEPWQRVEISRQAGRIRAGLEQVSRLIARTRVLQAEQRGQAGLTTVNDPVGSRDQSILLVNDEEWQRSLITMSGEAERLTLAKALDDAKAEFQDRSGRSALLQETLDLRRKRVDSMSALAEKRLIANPVLAQVKAELADVSDRMRQTDIDEGIAMKNVARAERQLAIHDLESRVEREKTVATTEQSMIEAVSTAQADLSVFDSLVPDGPAQGEGSTRLEIIRRTPEGVRTIEAIESTIMEPGDVVRLGPAQ